jgi:putative glutamine amidotransferase
MRRPVVGVIGNAHRIEDRFTTQMVGERNLRAVVEVCGALPLMFAGSPEITDIGTLLDVVDGVVLTGARANVHRCFNFAPHGTNLTISTATTSHSRCRKPASSAACLSSASAGAAGVNVAFGGSLHPETGNPGAH